MAENKVESACRECGHPATPDPVVRDAWRCSNCGSPQRRFSIQLNERLGLRQKLRGKIKEPGRRRPRFEFTEGDDLYRKSGRWMKLSRRIDRTENRYQKMVTDPETREVVHHCDEPLTDHTGHGSAKRKLPTDGE